MLLVLHPPRPPKLRLGWFRLLSALMLVLAGSAEVAAERLQVQPAVTRVEVGDTVRFRARIVDGENVSIPAALQWRAQGGGVIDSQGRFHAQQPGRYTVTATTADGRAIGTAQVVVGNEPRGYGQLRIVPAEARLRPGQRRHFRALLIGREGEAVPAVPIWSASGGRIDAQGVFVAGSRPGVYRVRARHPRTRLQASVVVRIQARR